MDNDIGQLTFNLWVEPWIDLERPDGTIDRQGILGTLLHAHEYREVFSSSPTDVVGIHRLLMAILQDIFHPSGVKDWHSLQQAGHFSGGALQEFGEKYANRFDLFSVNAPFMQSSDLPLRPEKSGTGKPVTYLAPELPCATAVNHYHHVLDDEQAFCPVCCARGLVNIPAFATSGGSGIKPSINGVPPMYVLPGGKNLFDSLLASLILPIFQPPVRTVANDSPWWKGPTTIEKKGEVLAVGYLESLTFPARRVRLYPQYRDATCTRCGNATRLVVSEMTFEMGLSRPKDAPFWRDPFVAYFLRQEDSPLPLRPTAGKAAWREYASLFLQVKVGFEHGNERVPIRPAVIDQLARLNDDDAYSGDSFVPFRCIGLRTDKAKVFEWVDSTFNIPMALMESSNAGLDVDRAIKQATFSCDTMAGCFSEIVNSNKKKGKRLLQVKLSMQDSFWTAMAEPFRGFIGKLTEVYSSPAGNKHEQTNAILQEWSLDAYKAARKELIAALEQVGDDGHNLRLRFQCLESFDRTMYFQMKKEGLKHE